MTAAPRKLLRPARWAMLAALVAGMGCRSMPMTRYYLLELPPPAATEAAGTGDGLGELRVGVAKLAVEAPYDQERIAYRPPGAAQEIAFYHYHRWSAPVGSLAQGVLARALDRLAGIAAEPAREGETYDLVLRAVVLRLEEIDAATGIEAELALRWTASGPDGASRSGEERVEQPVAAPEVDAVVEAFARAFEHAARQIGDDLLAAR